MGGPLDTVDPWLSLVPAVILAAAGICTAIAAWKSAIAAKASSTAAKESAASMKKMVEMQEADRRSRETKGQIDTAMHGLVETLKREFGGG